MGRMNVRGSTFDVFRKQNKECNVMYGKHEGSRFEIRGFWNKNKRVVE
jgi:hypothetical protein